MVYRIIMIFLFLSLTSLVFGQQRVNLTTGKIVYLDKQLEKIIPLNAKLEIIGSGFQHIEGPVWIADSSCLLFSDTKAATIYRWSAKNGVSKFLDNAGYTGRLPYSEEPGSNGLALAKNQTLIICEHGDRRIALYPLNGKYGLKTFTDNYQGKRFNSPNDVIVKSDGSIYFTDPSYGLPMKEKDSTKEINFSGIYQVDNNGVAQLFSHELPFPNGLALSPDEQFLYVSNSEGTRSQILKYSVKDPQPAKGVVFFDATHIERLQENQITDGLKTDKSGNVWASGPGGLLIIDKSGKLIGKIITYEVISNCAWDDEAKTLYMTAGSFLYRLILKGS